MTPDDRLEPVWELLRALRRIPEAATPDCPQWVAWNGAAAVAVGSSLASLGQAPAAGTLALGSIGSGALSAVGLQNDTDRELVQLYGALCHPGAKAAWVLAHLGQSLDGRISSPSGAPEPITGQADRRHNHRLRALADAVLVGAGTVAHDDPLLNVRLCTGPDPVRVVWDPGERLSAEFRVFRQPQPPTLLLAAEGAEPASARGRAAVVRVAEGHRPKAVLETLRARGLRRVFIEGGGVTVSRFLESDCLDWLQIAVAPYILGCGKPGVELSRVARLRLNARRFLLGPDVLFDCRLSSSGSFEEGE